MESDDSSPDGANFEGCDNGARALSSRSASLGNERHRLSALVRTIEGEIVPRLLMGSRSMGGTRLRPDSTRNLPEPGDVDELARILVTHGASMACAFVAAVHDRGAPYDRICLDLLAPAAQRLVDGWERQDLSYPELGSGLEALHAVVLEVSHAARSDRPVSTGT
jgi:hypothetical protein